MSFDVHIITQNTYKEQGLKYKFEFNSLKYKENFKTSLQLPLKMRVVSFILGKTALEIVS